MTATDYIELRAHSAYSLLRGTASPETLLAETLRLNMRGLALTDHNNVYGAISFQKAAQGLGHPTHPRRRTHYRISHSKSEISFRPSPPSLWGRGCALTLLVATEAGWENLCWLITQAQHQAPKGEGLLQFEQLDGHTEGLIALSGGREGEIARVLESEGACAARQLAERYAALFDRERFFIELHHHRHPYDDQRIAALTELAEALGLDSVATNHVHYPAPADKPLADVVTAIRHNRALNEVGAQLFPNGQHHLKSAETMRALFHRYPRALENTIRIAAQCSYQLPSELQALPRYPLPVGTSAQAYLARLCRGSTRYQPNMEKRLQHELAIIEVSGLANYFLVVWDIVRFSWETGIRCQGRGSVANSLVAYLLKIAPIDPIEHRLVFERFLSPERQMTPDIDMDFDAETREEVIQYLYEKYGRTHAAMACYLRHLPPSQRDS